jgi:hypothetical protein
MVLLVQLLVLVAAEVAALHQVPLEEVVLVGVVVDIPITLIVLVELL